MRCRSCTPIPEEVRRAADLLERRWTVSIIWASHEGAVRFNEFSQSLGSIPPATLATRLVELEQAGILARATVEGRPPRTEYRLTARGLELRGLVAALRQVAAALRRAVEHRPDGPHEIDVTRMQAGCVRHGEELAAPEVVDRFATTDEDIREGQLILVGGLGAVVAVVGV